MKLFNLFKNPKEMQQHYVINNIEIFNIGDEVYPINVRMLGPECFIIGDKARVRRASILIEEAGYNIEYSLRYKDDICLVNHKNAFKTKDELLKFIATV